MAFYEEENDELNPEGQAPGTGPQSSVLGAQGASSPTGAPVSAATPDSPGGFVGIKQYLDANKSQSQKLGSDVASSLGKTIGGASESIGKLGGQFESLVGQNTLSGLDTAADEAKGIVTQAASGQKANVLSEPGTKRFSDIANATYKGPRSIEETEIWNPAVSQAQGAQKQADLTKTESGRSELLRDLYKAPSYSRGENQFDTYLLGSQGSRDKLNQAIAPASQFQGILDAVSGKAKESAQSVSDKTDITREAARSGLTSTQGSRGAEVTGDLTKAQTDINNLLGGIAQKLQARSGNIQLTPQELSILGLREGQSIYNMTNNDVAQYLKSTFDQNKYISPDQQAQLAALDTLSGTYGGTQANPFTQPQLAGTDTRGYTDPSAQIGSLLSQKKDQFVSTVAQGLNFHDPKWNDPSNPQVQFMQALSPWAIDQIKAAYKREIFDGNINYEPGDELRAIGAMLEGLRGYKGQPSPIDGQIVKGSEAILSDDRAFNRNVGTAPVAPQSIDPLGKPKTFTVTQ